MSKPSNSRQDKFSVARSIGSLICIFGILVGLILIGVGDGISESSVSTWAGIDTGELFGGIVNIVGFIAFLISTVGLIALIGSRFAKSLTARGFLNFLGASAALINVGAGVFVLAAYLDLRAMDQ